MTERYADNVFIAVAQDGFTKVIGNPTQVNETVYQVDLNLQANYDDFRGRVGAFESAIINYSTFSTLAALDPTGARVFYTTTTPLATLAGVEAYGEGDLSQSITAFGGAYYVTGRDQTINQPLMQIYPLDTRLGVRWHDTDKGSKWGFEAYERMVAHQHQLGSIRTGAPGFVEPGVYTAAELPTPGFAITNLRYYYNVNKNFSWNAGVNNLFNTNYIEHLSLRLPAQAALGTQPGYSAAGVYSPGFTFYLGGSLTL